MTGGGVFRWKTSPLSWTQGHLSIIEDVGRLSMYAPLHTSLKGLPSSRPLQCRSCFAGWMELESPKQAIWFCRQCGHRVGLVYVPLPQPGAK